MKAVDPGQRDAARAAVAPIAERHRLVETLLPYEKQRWSGALPRVPIFNLDDVSAIPFLDGISGVGEYQHRARLRAFEGDLFAAGTPQTRGYERYCRQQLGLGTVGFVLAEAEEAPLAVAEACLQGEALRRIVAATRLFGGLVIHPYMGIEAVWNLAARVAAESDCPVTVIAPPPPVTWIANDKAIFGEVVTRVLGPEWLVETFETDSADDLARHLVDLAARHPRIALKRLRCASAMGNEVFDSSRISTGGFATARRLVDSFLERTEWPGGEEVQAVAWEHADLSPSTQLWIPPDGHGEPRVDGIYEQILEGEHRVFVGSRASGLPSTVEERLSEASLRVATALQALGYAGRCSFDFLVIGEPDAECELRITECNGRWGGTSTPMALLDRLVDGPRPPYRAQDFVRSGLVGAEFKELLAATRDELYDPASRQGRLVFYNVGPLAGSGKIDVIALGRSREEADEMILERLPSLLGV